MFTLNLQFVSKKQLADTLDQLMIDSSGGIDRLPDMMRIQCVIRNGNCPKSPRAGRKARPPNSMTGTNCRWKDRDISPVRCSAGSASSAC